MKANELTVNDWYFLDGEVQQIMPTVIDYVWNDFCPPLDIKPIPLTQDILLSNGFEKRHIRNCERFRLYSEKFIIYAETDGRYFGIDTYTNCGKFEDFKAEYVHELQHLLRIAGFDDLADNFKIM